MIRKATVLGLCFVLALPLDAVAETKNDTMTRIRETSGEVVGGYVRDIIAGNGCTIKVVDVQESRSFFAVQLADRFDITPARGAEVKGILVDAMERGFNQLQREDALDYDLNNGSVSLKECK